VGVPVQAWATHSPVVPPLPVLSQMGPPAEPAHCESDVQGPQVLGVDAPQMGEVATVHWVLVQQLPGTQLLLQQKSAELPVHVVSAVQPLLAVHSPLAQ
jgi:hypothetical protein